MGGIVSIALAITTVAIIGVIFTSPQTASIISSTTGGYANALSAALPPKGGY